jgi:hypothetical protein
MRRGMQRRRWRESLRRRSIQRNQGRVRRMITSRCRGSCVPHPARISWGGVHAGLHGLHGLLHAGLHGLLHAGLHRLLLHRLHVGLHGGVNRLLHRWHVRVHRLLHARLHLMLHRLLHAWLHWLLHRLLHARLHWLLHVGLHRLLQAGNGIRRRGAEDNRLSPPWVVFVASVRDSDRSTTARTIHTDVRAVNGRSGWFITQEKARTTTTVHEEPVRRIPGTVYWRSDELWHSSCIRRRLTIRHILRRRHMGLHHGTLRLLRPVGGWSGCAAKGIEILRPRRGSPNGR